MKTNPPPLQNFLDHLGQSRRGASEVSREQHAKLSRTRHRNISPPPVRNSYQMGIGMFTEVDYLSFFFFLFLSSSSNIRPASGGGGEKGRLLETRKKIKKK